MVDLDSYFKHQSARVEKYGGQLSPEFQKALVEYHAGVEEKDCDFYHTITLTNGRVVEGEWDLRDHQKTYLGECDVRGKRVLEVGPATGSLSAYMALEGANLVIFDLPFGSCPDLVPFAEIDAEELAASGARSAGRLRNSWWFTQKNLGFEAGAVYGDVYDPPSDIGRFDMTVFGAILLHLSNPFRALQKFAAITENTIVVTDIFSGPARSALASSGSHGGAHLIFAPSEPPSGVVHWWALSPDAIVFMLSKLGFSDATVTTHSPEMMTSKPPLFTVVAHRTVPLKPAQAAPLAG